MQMDDIDIDIEGKFRYYFNDYFMGKIQIWGEGYLFKRSFVRINFKFLVISEGIYLEF